MSDRGWKRWMEDRRIIRQTDRLSVWHTLSGRQ